MDDDGSRESERYRRGLPDYHDPAAGIGGAPPARSALTLRLALAILGLLAGIGLAIWATLAEAPAVLVVLPIVMAVTAVIDIVVVVRRKARGEPG